MKCQPNTLDFQKWQKWQQSLNRIEQEMRGLCFVRGMFERVHSLTNNSKNLKKCPSDLFFVWSWNCYIVCLGMGIRRLVDKRSNEKNLYQLLEDIKENACQISVENYAQYMFEKKRHKKRINNSSDKTDNQKTVLIESYEKSERKLARRVFKEALGNRAQSLLCCDVGEDIKKIEKGPKKKVEKFVDKCWAHLDKKPNAPQLREVYEAFDLLINIYNKYSLLTAGHKFHLPEEVLFNQWDSPFRMVWIE
jgi:hypothetical protein